MSSNSFLFVNGIESFEESQKGAVCDATFLTLDKVSENGRRYNFEDSDLIIETLRNAPIRLGITITGKHRKSRQVGVVKQVFMEGKTVKGKILVTAKDIISKLKKGVKFLLSVGGKALGALTKFGKKMFMNMIKPQVTHVQMFSVDEGKSGFPEAKVNRVIDFGESLLYCSEKSIAHLVALDVI